jgi:hypothetical protein
MGRKALTIFLVMMLLLCGCIKSDDSNIDNGVNEMGERLLTKAEFLKIVSENEGELGMTVADFDDVDINDFIKVKKFTETIIGYYTSGRINFIASFDSYVSGIEWRKIKTYQPQEMRIAESTDEDYERFLSKYIKKLGGGDSVVTPFILTSEIYIIQEGDYRAKFEIFRTQDIEQYEEGWVFSENPAGVVTILSQDGKEGRYFYLSTNGKFFIVFYAGPHTEHTVKAFCEIND